MKKILSLILTVIMLLSATTVLADNDVNAVGAINATTLNVRNAPDMNAEIIGSLSYSSRINIITKTGDWYKINYNGVVGYIYCLYAAVSRSGNPVVYDSSVDRSFQTEEGAAKGEQVLNMAKTFLGVPYVWGGTSPSGFDCSGLVYYVYKQFGVTLNRVAADMTAAGIPVTYSELKPGDIVFFHNTSRYTRINHVGIYAGNGMFIHAPQTGDVVKFSPLNSGYYSTTFVTARRIFE